MIEKLPDPGPRWFEQEIIPNSGEPLHPVSLFYRDPIKAIKSLLARPSLACSMEFVPRRVWSDATREKRLYSEISTGEWWWRNQVSEARISLRTQTHGLLDKFACRSYHNPGTSRV
jgi:hypothetical protein